MNPKITLVPLLLFQPTLDNKKDGNKCKDVLKKEAIAPLTLNKTPRKCVAVSTAQYVHSLSDVRELFRGGGFKGLDLLRLSITLQV